MSHLVFAHGHRAMKVLSVVHVFAVEAPALHRRPEPLEVPRIVGCIGFRHQSARGHGCSPLRCQDVGRGQARRGGPGCWASRWGTQRRNACSTRECIRCVRKQIKKSFVRAVMTLAQPHTKWRKKSSQEVKKVKGSWEIIVVWVSLSLDFLPQKMHPILFSQH